MFSAHLNISPGKRRNVGIAIVEGYWHSTPGLHGVLIPLLVNQAIYLLEQSAQEDAVHEVDNCNRIMNLLADGSDVDTNFVAYYDALLATIRKKAARERSAEGERAGVHVPAETLELWSMKLQAKMTTKKATNRVMSLNIRDT
jgi:hypothetical protein